MRGDSGFGVISRRGQIAVPLRAAAERNAIGEVRCGERHGGDLRLPRSPYAADQIAGQVLLCAEAKAQAVSLGLERHLALERVRPAEVSAGRVGPANLGCVAARSAKRGSGDAQVVAVPDQVLIALAIHRNLRKDEVAHQRHAIIGEFLRIVGKRHIQRTRRHKAYITAHRFFLLSASGGVNSCKSKTVKPPLTRWQRAWGR